jgi:hypothetical protein
MLFTPDDDFTDHTQTWDLPDCAVALLTRAGSWSARNSQDGFVPSAMLARFSSDPVPAVAELTRRKVWRRVKGGYQFSDWERWGETTEQVERRRADAAERKRRSRARKKEEAQVSVGAVKGMSRVTFCDPVTGDDLDLDLDPYLSPPGSKSQSDAQARDEAKLLATVVRALCKQAGRLVTNDEARTAMGVLEVRAEKAGTVIDDAAKYFCSAIRREKDIEGLLNPEPPPIAEIVAGILGDGDDGKPREWCGKCDKRTRFLLDEVGQPGTKRCPDCGPQAKARSA